jgi:hypothetical protein
MTDFRLSEVSFFSSFIKEGSEYYALGLRKRKNYMYMNYILIRCDSEEIVWIVKRSCV